MQIQYQLTYWDFESAVEFTRPDAARFARRHLSYWMLLSYFCVGAIFSAGLLWLQKGASPDRAVAGDPPLPAVVIAILFLAASTVRALRSGRFRDAVSMCFALLFVLGAVLLVMGAAGTFSRGGISHLLSPHVGWILITAVIVTSFLGQQSQQAALLWQGMPNLHQTLSLTADEDGIHLGNPLLSTTFTWFAFLKFAETSSAFLLYEGELSYHIIPKRAFTTAQLDEFRDLLNRHIAQRQSAFPVIPLNSQQS